jgi:hypothetical protein
MNRRVRFLAALLALVGFTALLAENLVAMSCMPANVSDDTGMHAGLQHATHAAPENEPEDPAPQHCPLVMAGGSCLVPVILPAATSYVKVPESARRADPASVPDAADELVVRTLFHPPKI